MDFQVADADQRFLPRLDRNGLAAVGGRVLRKTECLQLGLGVQQPSTTVIPEIIQTVIGHGLFGDFEFPVGLLDRVHVVRDRRQPLLLA